MKKELLGILVRTVFLCGLSYSVVFAEGAMDQLENMENTGVAFDGSDGRRSGMDIDFTDTTVEIPEPTAQPVDTEDNE